MLFSPYAVIAVIGLTACVIDLRTGRIPNVLTFSTAAAGVVYHTDTINARVSTIATVGDLNIVHSAAVIAGPRAVEARRFLDFLKSDQARAVFTKRGFDPQ